MNHSIFVQSMGKKGCRKNRKKKFQPLEQWLTTQQQSYPPQPQGWIDLPAHLTENILQRLGPIEILETAQNVCSTWRTVCQDPLMWRVIDMTYFPNYYHRTLNCCSLHRRRMRFYRLLRNTCRLAVDHSKGELIDIKIGSFADDDLLLYVSDQSSHLKRLTIKYCNSMTVNGLTTAVTKLPDLEELHLSCFNYIKAEHIQTIGKCCPMLKSLTFKVSACNQGVDNRCALAIARNMTNLRHIGLAGNALSYGGVKAILDGCPRLEWIDLRDCFNVAKDKRLCFESINELRRLFDRSTGDSDAWASYETSFCSDLSIYATDDGSDDESDDESDDDNHYDDDDDADDDDDEVDDIYRSNSKVLRDDFCSCYSNCYSKVRRWTRT